jgi:hypothetical protein
MKSAPRTRSLLCIATLALLALPVVARAQGHDPGPNIAAQKAAMQPLSILDGTWRGKGRVMMGEGKWVDFTQTERIGNMLGGTVKVIEGRGFDAEGKVSFEAFALLGYDARKKAYSFRSFARGEVGDFPFTATDSGFVWEVKVPNMTMRYTTVVKDGRWHEVGERIVEGKPPVKFIELDLQRIGDTDWPAAGAVAPK